jgi:hypothetical protein
MLLVFKVKESQTGRILTVYAVSKDGNSTYFLMSPPNHGCWYWDDDYNYDPIYE